VDQHEYKFKNNKKSTDFTPHQENVAVGFPGFPGFVKLTKLIKPGKPQSGSMAFLGTEHQLREPFGGFAKPTKPSAYVEAFTESSA
jgi:hypothetical protein